MDDNPDLKQLEKRIPYLGPHGLLTFPASPQARNDVEGEVELAHRIGLIDKQAFRELGFGTSHWEYVIQQLVNAIQLGVEDGHVEEGRKSAEKAEQLLVYYRCLLPNNRVAYERVREVSGERDGLFGVAGIR